MISFHDLFFFFFCLFVCFILFYYFYSYLTPSLLVPPPGNSVSLPGDGMRSEKDEGGERGWRADAHQVGSPGRFEAYPEIAIWSDLTKYFLANITNIFLEIKLNIKFITLNDQFNAFFVAKFPVMRKKTSCTQGCFFSWHKFFLLMWTHAKY